MKRGYLLLNVIGSVLCTRVDLTQNAYTDSDLYIDVLKKNLPIDCYAQLKLDIEDTVSLRYSKKHLDYFDFIDKSPEKVGSESWYVETQRISSFDALVRIPTILQEYSNSPNNKLSGEANIKKTLDELKERIVEAQKNYWTGYFLVSAMNSPDFAQRLQVKDKEILVVSEDTDAFKTFILNAGNVLSRQILDAGILKSRQEFLQNWKMIDVRDWTLELHKYFIGDINKSGGMMYLENSLEKPEIVEVFKMFIQYKRTPKLVREVVMSEYNKEKALNRGSLLAVKNKPFPLSLSDLKSKSLDDKPKAKDTPEEVIFSLLPSVQREQPEIKTNLPVIIEAEREDSVDDMSIADSRAKRPQRNIRSNRESRISSMSLNTELQDNSELLSKEPREISVGLHHKYPIVIETDNSLRTESALDVADDVFLSRASTPSVTIDSSKVGDNSKKAKDKEGKRNWFQRALHIGKDKKSEKNEVPSTKSTEVEQTSDNLAEMKRAAPGSQNFIDPNVLHALRSKQLLSPISENYDVNNQQNANDSTGYIPDTGLPNSDLRELNTRGATPELLSMECFSVPHSSNVFIKENTDTANNDSVAINSQEPITDSMNSDWKKQEFDKLKDLESIKMVTDIEKMYGLGNKNPQENTSMPNKQVLSEQMATEQVADKKVANDPTPLINDKAKASADSIKHEA
ncbi:hypothetical protein NEAUS07_1011 [Nematocida ausubeli]|nr:hypothetical protein NEAUS07_1011 [Nematocida ausubeli]